jgi:hypothetical protein
LSSLEGKNRRGGEREKRGRKADQRRREWIKALGIRVKSMAVLLSVVCLCVYRLNEPLQQRDVLCHQSNNGIIIIMDHPYKKFVDFRLLMGSNMPYTNQSLSDEYKKWTITVPQNCEIMSDRKGNLEGSTRMRQKCSSLFISNAIIFD